MQALWQRRPRTKIFDLIVDNFASDCNISQIQSMQPAPKSASLIVVLCATKALHSLTTWRRRRNNFFTSFKLVLWLCSAPRSKDLYRSDLDILKTESASLDFPAFISFIIVSKVFLLTTAGLVSSLFLEFLYLIAMPVFIIILIFSASQPYATSISHLNRACICGLVQFRVLNWCYGIV